MSIQTEPPVSRADRYQARKIELLEQIAEGGGGGGVTVEALTVPSNGEYTAPEGKAYSPVTVSVPNSYAAADEGKVVSNGALVSQTAHATVTENGPVDTTTNNSVTVAVPTSKLLANEDVTFVSAASEIQIPVAKDAAAFVVIITPSDDVVTALQDSSVTSFYNANGVVVYPPNEIAALGQTAPAYIYRYRGSTSTGGYTTIAGITSSNKIVTITTSATQRFFTGDYNFKIYELA